MFRASDLMKPANITRATRRASGSNRNALGSRAAHATDREFKDVVNAIADEFHTRPTHIPFFGLVNVVTFGARPAGTKHIDLAVFEHLDSHDRDGRDLARSIRRAVGSAW